MASAGGSLEAGDVSVRTSIVPPGPCPPSAGTPDTSPAATKQQLTASFHDFAVSLAGHPRHDNCAAHFSWTRTAATAVMPPLPTGPSLGPLGKTSPILYSRLTSKLLGMSLCRYARTSSAAARDSASTSTTRSRSGGDE